VTKDKYAIVAEAEKNLRCLLMWPLDGGKALMTFAKRLVIVWDLNWADQQEHEMWVQLSTKDRSGTCFISANGHVRRFFEKVGVTLDGTPSVFFNRR